MAGPYSQGGGGGKAGSPTSSGQYALNQPYEISFPVTAAEIQKLNESLRVLYKNSTTHKTNIQTVQAQVNNITTAINNSQIALNSTNIGTASSVPINLLAAQGTATLIVPILVTLEIAQTSQYTVNGNASWRVRYAGTTVDIVTATASDFGTSRNKYFVFPVSALSLVGSNSAMTNKALQLSLSADPTGGGASGLATLTYYTVTGSPL